jgi:ribosomal protein S18 acetylase RimI-like enzyme
MRLALRSFSDVRETRYIGLLERAGFQRIRHSFRMGITFKGPPDTGSDVEGLSVRPAEMNDMQAVFEAWRDAWRDHYGSVPRPLDIEWAAWQHEWEHKFAPGLWWLACDGDTVAGLCLCMPEYGGNESVGFIQLVAVRRAYRRRGIAEAVLRRSLAAAYAAGKTSVILYVDGASLTGATKLYEKAGMSVLRTYTMCEKELRDGVDPSVREAG